MVADSKHKQSIEQRAGALAEPILAAEGFELVDVEFVHEREGWVLRLFIDKLDKKEGKEGGVGLDDCSKASRAVDTALEVEEIIPHEYHLEVSSPGLNRPLTKPSHFAQAVGKKVRIKTYAPVAVSASSPPSTRSAPDSRTTEKESASRKNFLGVLKSFDGDTVTVQVEGGGPFCIPLKDIAKANLEFEFVS